MGEPEYRTLREKNLPGRAGISLEPPPHHLHRRADHFVPGRFNRGQVQSLGDGRVVMADQRRCANVLLAAIFQNPLGQPVVDAKNPFRSCGQYFAGDAVTSSTCQPPA